MKRFFLEYFSFSKKELTGILVLVFIIILVFIFPYFYSLFMDKDNFEHSDFTKKADKFYADNLTKEVKSKEKTKYLKLNKTSLFNFDPNYVTKSELVKLGFSQKQIAVFINYRNSGAKFYKPDDLQNVYGISKQQYKKLKPFVKIKNTVKHSKLDTYKPKAEKNKQVKQNTFIELNSADTTVLKSLRGIGSVLAMRIVKYRYFLGGFYDKNQLLEVYGLKKEVLEKISENIIIDTSLIKKIDINKSDFKSLNKHPYITFANTKSILKYRELMGSFTNLQQLLKNNLVDTIIYNKITPYLSLN